MMNKILKSMSVILVAFSISKCANANDLIAEKFKLSDYNRAVVGNVIQNEINGDRTDVERLFEQELKRNAHKYALETIIILQQYLPEIIENITAKMRQDADRAYKESLLRDTNITN